MFLDFKIKKWIDSFCTTSPLLILFFLLLLFLILLTIRFCRFNGNNSHHIGISLSMSKSKKKFQIPPQSTCNSKIYGNVSSYMSINNKLKGYNCSLFPFHKDWESRKQQIILSFWGDICLVEE